MVEETYDLSKGVAEGTGTGVDKKKLNPNHEIRNSKQIQMTEIRNFKLEHFGNWKI